MPSNSYSSQHRKISLSIRGLFLPAAMMFFSGCGGGDDEMTKVPEGSFMMGCNEAVDDECGPAEYPYHEVDLPAFEIDRLQVTVLQYSQCVEAGACTPPSSGNYCNWEQNHQDHPINCIIWTQARAYCQWAGKRLCTEAEWEKAARGTDGRKYPWGNETVTCDYAVFNEKGQPGDSSGCDTDSTWPVGSKPNGASPYGALDMLGNLWDWVEDDWHDDYTGAPTDGSAWIDEPRPLIRVGRGGGFQNFSSVLRVSLRYGGLADFSSPLMGARCCI